MKSEAEEYFNEKWYDSRVEKPLYIGSLVKILKEVRESCVLSWGGRSMFDETEYTIRK